MKTLVFAAVTAAALVTAAPASAQVYLGAGPGGAGVEVGPFGAGVGPRYGWRDHRLRSDGFDRHAPTGDQYLRRNCRDI